MSPGTPPNTNNRQLQGPRPHLGVQQVVVWHEDDVGLLLQVPRQVVRAQAAEGREAHARATGEVQALGGAPAGRRPGCTPRPLTGKQEEGAPCCTGAQTGAGAWGLQKGSLRDGSRHQFSTTAADHLLKNQHKQKTPILFLGREHGNQKENAQSCLCTTQRPEAIRYRHKNRKSTRVLWKPDEWRRLAPCPLAAGSRSKSVRKPGLPGSAVVTLAAGTASLLPRYSKPLFSHQTTINFTISQGSKAKEVAGPALSWQNLFQKDGRAAAVWLQGSYLCLFPLLTRSSMSRMVVASSRSRLFSEDTGKNKDASSGPMSPRRPQRNTQAVTLPPGRTRAPNHLRTHQRIPGLRL